jgi:hypothetical protein
MGRNSQLVFLARFFARPRFQRLSSFKTAASGTVSEARKAPEYTPFKGFRSQYGNEMYQELRSIRILPPPSLAFQR